MMFGGGGMILSWAVLLFGGYFVVKYFTDQSKKNNADYTDALTILKRRYANGEISQQEFEERKRILTNT